MKDLRRERQLRNARKKATKIVASIARWVFLIAIGYILLYPLLYMLSASFRLPTDFYDSTVVWVNKNFSTNNITVAWDLLKYFETLWVTFKVEIVSALIEVITCAITAYGLARFEFKEKKILMGILMLTILIPTQLIMIPLMMSMKYLDVFGILGFISELIGFELRPNLLDTPFAFYLPSLFGVGLKAGLFIFMYIQFFKGLPKELEEAASIDGAGPIKTFTTIVVPSSGVIFLTVTIFSVIWHWNDTYLATLFLNTEAPLAVSLSRIFETLNSNGISKFSLEVNGYAMAACLLFILPMLIMYCILQKWFIKSIDRIGIVG